MPRPRTHDPDAALDAAEAIAARSGPAAVTIRAVAQATGLSNGALYHTFGSRAELLGRTWLRAARRFLDVQTGLVDAHPAPAPDDPPKSDRAEPFPREDHDLAVAAIVAAADAPGVFTERFPYSSRLLLTVSRDQLIGEKLPATLAEELADADRALVRLMVRLARRLWGRGDRRAVEVMTTCLVDLPTAILLRRDRITDPLAREHLRAAVRAVLAVGPNPNPHPQPN
ncbi:helix-turn-helix domain-containing protein [Nocardia arizonensis]|uniref:helix-turn-helix domain-containing protein n=1 Tax=Nocardia arizonensis TaxID=1141647 RepID=UPI0006D06863|nr:helix-turn-helix domain-containing protein [Nocardia arizonensis]